MKKNKIVNILTFRFNLHLHWTTTIFILNLALADFLYCVVNLPLYALQYLHQRWIWGPTLCYVTAGKSYFIYFSWFKSKNYPKCFDSKIYATCLSQNKCYQSIQLLGSNLGPTFMLCDSGRVICYLFFIFMILKVEGLKLQKFFWAFFSKNWRGPTLLLL